MVVQDLHARPHLLRSLELAANALALILGLPKVLPATAAIFEPACERRPTALVSLKVL